jgi:hypothetical protein
MKGSFEGLWSNEEMHSRSGAIGGPIGYTTS